MLDTTQSYQEYIDEILALLHNRTDDVTSTTNLNTSLLQIINDYRHKHLRYNVSSAHPKVAIDVWEYLHVVQGPRRAPMETVVVITLVYGFIFLSGIFGNVCTCLVIAKNKYMHTATNYYLFNLAIADLLLLLIGLPPETFSIWSAYPWVFGEAFCIARTMLAEMSTNASILTITAFTIERYVAICHPMKAQTMSGLKRVVRVIIAIWCLASLFSIPLTVQFKLVYVVDNRNRTIKESASCNIGDDNYIETTFEISTFLFFIFPMTLVTVMYSLIALAIRRSGLNRGGSDTSNMDRLTGFEMRAQQQARARRSVLKMLVAVVVGFFCCWAPFHAQRLMTLYIPAAKWTSNLLDAHFVIYYISGVCYFISCTINPILYSIMSLKFRQAFKQTVLRPRCCKRRIQKTKKRTYFSYRFSHKNGYSETSFTSVEPGSPARSVNNSHHSHSHSHSDHSNEHGQQNGGVVNNINRDEHHPKSVNNKAYDSVRQIKNANSYGRGSFHEKSHGISNYESLRSSKKRHSEEYVKRERKDTETSPTCNGKYVNIVKFANLQDSYEQNSSEFRLILIEINNALDVDAVGKVGV